MVTTKQQADNCLTLFRGNPVSTIERALKCLDSSVKKELCTRFNCNEDTLAFKIANG